METCIRGFSTTFAPENKVEVIPLQVSKLFTSHLSTMLQIEPRTYLLIFHLLFLYQ